MSIQLVGILNVTNDSFSDGGEYLDPVKAVKQAHRLFEEGASMVDIGAEATNPWAHTISVDEEWRRLKPIVQKLLPERADFSFSIDTRHPEIIERAAEYGKFVVNDVTTFTNPAMIELTARYGLMAIASHLPLEAAGDIGRAHRDFKMTSAAEVRRELLHQKAKMVAGGIAAEQIVLDPGIGFGKSMKLNWQLLGFAQLVPGHAVMIGFSRKRFLAADPATGELIPGHDKLDQTLNQRAAKIATNAPHGELWLRVHELSLY